VVCLSVCRSACRSVTILSHAEMAERTEMPFGMWTRVGPGNRVLDWVQIRRMNVQFWGETLSARQMAG